MMDTEGEPQRVLLIIALHCLTFLDKTNRVQKRPVHKEPAGEVNPIRFAE
jgi:hypothetical protein